MLRPIDFVSAQALPCGFSIASELHDFLQDKTGMGVLLAAFYSFLSSFCIHISHYIDFRSRSLVVIPR
jgi:hypothetical protein